MRKIGIICLLPEEVTNYHQELCLKLINHFGLSVNFNVPAHITVKYPFSVDEDISEIEKVAQDFCASQVRTKWILRDFSHFINPNDYVVFIDALASKKVREVHRDFLNRLHKINWVQWGQFDNADLHYHVTLATHGITSTNYEEIWTFLNEQEKPNFEVFFDNLAFVQIDGDSRSVHKKYRFSN